jgi:ABC-type transport system involved in cytochrome bd biosynthesis fused ATPase/permease subunit
MIDYRQLVADNLQKTGIRNFFKRIELAGTNLATAIGIPNGGAKSNAVQRRINFMMINKRLIGTVRESKKYIAANVALQWCSLVANIALMAALMGLLQGVYTQTAQTAQFAATLGIAAVAIAVRFACTVGAAQMSYRSSKAVKRILRERIYQKLLRLGAAYNTQIKTSEIVQVAVEGVDQLETYFGAYLPQFFYAMLAPLTLFAFLSTINLPSAIVLLVCVPLIPVAIAAVQTWAKKLLGKYWGQYTTLGDTFLENLQGLTTLKIYQADEYKAQEMDRQAEQFRKITMKVLTMQLNSITIMDLIAYGGAALGVIFAATQYRSGAVSLAGCLLIIVLSAEFFIPMRQLGSFFHIAMNGMAASDKIFALLDLPEPKNNGTQEMPADCSVAFDAVSFAYEPGRAAVQDVSLVCPQGSLVALVGESGCGKSTLASILMGRSKGFSGSVTVGGVPLQQICTDELLKNITYVGHQSYLFRGTVRENLCMANPNATDEQLWEVLERTKLAAFLRTEQGLDTMLAERGENLSGGQCQRLALARAFLHDSPLYIFDEATSNIDVESENELLEQIYTLAKTKTVLLIAHRLANVVNADDIYVLERGCVVQHGTHQALTQQPGVYQALWTTQQQLECGETKGATR